MSEPTYRVEVEHIPESAFNSVPWRASVYRLSDGERVTVEYGPAMEVAFDKAQAWVKRAAVATQYGTTVMLTEDGEIHDRHAAGVLRDANA